MRRTGTPQAAPPGANYKWVALSNTTLGIFMSFINASSVLIALPAIFRGIKLDALEPANFNYLLWTIIGYTLVQAVLVVTLGRVGDMFGRVKIYNLGFVVFTVGSVLLSLTWSTGPAGAMEIILFRLLQAVGGACLMANSLAILTDAFPEEQRGFALGMNLVAGLFGSFVGLVAGGLLATVNWRLVFLINVPAGIAGTIWSYVRLQEIGEHHAEHIDWPGNLTFAAGLTMLIVGLSYGIGPSGTSSMSWGTPFVLAMLIGGMLLLVPFFFIERYVPAPMFHLRLFRLRAFITGNVAALLSAIGAGGLQFMLIIWLQGVWLPLHGYAFEVTPLWAGIYMIPLTAGFLVTGPIAGRLSDRWGAKGLATLGLLLGATSFLLLIWIPVDFAYPVFALILFFNGVGSGLFASPNSAAIMNSVPRESRGAASGMRAAFQNMGTPVSIGVFFSLMVIGLSATVPQAMYNGLVASGVSQNMAEKLSGLPPVGYLFAAFLGYNPLGTLLGPNVLANLPPDAVATITGRSYFPDLIAAPFKHGLTIVLAFSVGIYVMAAIVSWMRGKRPKPAGETASQSQRQASVGRKGL